MLKTVWMDVTDLLEWGGHMTGVQRVMYETIIRLREDDSYQARFFRLSKNGRTLVECAIEPMLQRMVDQANTAPPANGQPAASRVKSIIRSSYFMIPESLRRKLTAEQKQRAKQVARTSLHHVRRLMARAKRLTSQPEHGSTEQAVQLTSQDTVLVVGKIWDDTRLVDLLAKQKQTIGFHYVTLIHDLIPVFQPHLFGPGLFNPYAQYLFEALTSCDHLLCVSNNTRKDVLRLAEILHAPHVAASVVTLGDSPLTTITPQRPSQVGEDEQFILAVGTIEARKNHAILYQAYKLAAERGETLPRLIIVGSGGWLTGDFMYVAAHDPATKQVITPLHHIPDSQIRWLYEHCLLTVYPSIYEGWGLPVRESLAYGKHCITSTAASLPEAAGGYASLVSPYDSGALLDQLVKDLKHVETLNARLAARYKANSWDDTYRAIKAAL